MLAKHIKIACFKLIILTCSVWSVKTNKYELYWKLM